MQHWAHKTQDEDKKKPKKIKTQKIEQMNNKDPTKTIGVNPGACEG